MNCSERFLGGRLCGAFPGILRKPKKLIETNKPGMLKKESKVAKIRMEQTGLSAVLGNFHETLESCCFVEEF